MFNDLDVCDPLLASLPCRRPPFFHDKLHMASISPADVYGAFLETSNADKYDTQVELKDAWVAFANSSVCLRL
jgi:hypothetical protein